MELYLKESYGNEPRSYIIRDPKDNTTLHIEPTHNKTLPSVKLEIHTRTNINERNSNYTLITQSIKGFWVLLRSATKYTYAQSSTPRKLPSQHPMNPLTASRVSDSSV